MTRHSMFVDLGRSAAVVLFGDGERHARVRFGLFEEQRQPLLLQTVFQLSARGQQVRRLLKPVVIDHTCRVHAMAGVRNEQTQAQQILDFFGDVVEDLVFEQLGNVVELRQNVLLFMKWKVASQTDEDDHANGPHAAKERI